MYGLTPIIPGNGGERDLALELRVGALEAARAGLQASVAALQNTQNDATQQITDLNDGLSAVGGSLGGLYGNQEQHELRLGDLDRSAPAAAYWLGGALFAVSGSAGNVTVDVRVNFGTPQALTVAVAPGMSAEDFAAALQQQIANADVTAPGGYILVRSQSIGFASGLDVTGATASAGTTVEGLTGASYPGANLGRVAYLESLIADLQAGLAVAVARLDALDSE